MWTMWRLRTTVTAATFGEVAVQVAPVHARRAGLGAQALGLGAARRLHGGLLLPYTAMSAGSTSALLPVAVTGTRGFAGEMSRAPSKGVHAPAGLTPKPSSMRVFLQSPGVLAEPYQKLPPFVQNPWGWIKSQVSGMIRSMYCIAMLRKHVVGFNQTQFMKQAEDMYVEINKHVSQQNGQELRHQVTEKAFAQFKREMKQHEMGGWKRVEWGMEKLTKMDIVQARLVQPSANDVDNSFAQITIEFTSKQKFAAFDASGKLVAGDPERTMNVVDYWVMERAMKQSGAKWRLAARITV